MKWNANVLPADMLIERRRALATVTLGAWTGHFDQSPYALDELHRHGRTDYHPQPSQQAAPSPSPPLFQSSLSNSSSTEHAFDDKNIQSPALFSPVALDQG
jgi:hypothetical protein